MTRLPLFVDPQHPAFDGHFPSRPIVPGVVLLDESLRAIAAYRAATGAPPLRAARIGVAKFLSVVGPGEALRLEVEPQPSGGAYRLRVLAGAPAHERVALTGDVVFEPQDVASIGEAR